MLSSFFQGQVDRDNYIGLIILGKLGCPNKITKKKKELVMVKAMEIKYINKGIFVVNF
jgi:hypothetical protein